MANQENADRPISSGSHDNVSLDKDIDKEEQVEEFNDEKNENQEIQKEEGEKLRKDDIVVQRERDKRRRKNEKNEVLKEIGRFEKKPKGVTKERSDMSSSLKDLEEIPSEEGDNNKEGGNDEGGNVEEGGNDEGGNVEEGGDGSHLEQLINEGLAEDKQLIEDIRNKILQEDEVQLYTERDARKAAKKRKRMRDMEIEYVDPFSISWKEDEWKDLMAHVEDIKRTHLRDLMNDAERSSSMILDVDGIILDYSRQCANQETMKKLFKLAEASQLRRHINRMVFAFCINTTENRSVLHVALRAAEDRVILNKGVGVMLLVQRVLNKIKIFSQKIRSGSWVGETGKTLKDVLVVGVGGSFLGTKFVHTALQTDPEAAACAEGRQLLFLANVDPIAVANCITRLNPETTLVVVVSKTFTTAETMLNARTLKEWISAALGLEAVAKHMVAVTTDVTMLGNLWLVEKLGIDPNNAFEFWEWVGERYSVCSAVGVLPLSIQYGFPVVEKFLNGAASIDTHFCRAPFSENIPVLLGLLSVWNTTFLEFPARAILSYSQALENFAPYIQQVSMESNGKGVSRDGDPLPHKAGEIVFGAGPNGLHNFYQLIHQGRVTPCDFIGVKKSQQSVNLNEGVASHHDELMYHFFAQPDALAYGKTSEQLLGENVPPHLIPHKTYSGNRPSLSLLLPSLNAYNVGQLLAIYEHQVAVQGFVLGINSFDQWGVELGEALASQVKEQVSRARTSGEPIEGFNHSTTTLLQMYLEEE